MEPRINSGSFVLSMGYGKHGQLGNGTMPLSSPLAVVASLTGRMIVKVAAGGELDLRPIYSEV